MTSDSIPVSITWLKSLWCLLKNFKRILDILHVFPHCEIMHLNNWYMEFKKEFFLLQDLALSSYLGPIDKQNIFNGMLLSFSGIVTMLKGNISLLSWFLYLQKVTSSLLLFSLRNSNSFGTYPWSYSEIFHHHWLHSRHQWSRVRTN